MITKERLENEIEFCLSCIDKGLGKYKYNYFPTENRKNKYAPLHNCGWTGGFWTGLLWLAYEMSGEKKYREVAEQHLLSYRERLVNDYDLDHHDLGFEYTLNSVSAYKITGNEFARESAIMAADALLRRFEPVGGFIKPWGAMNDPVENRCIVDTYLNLPLLFWATNETGNDKYKRVAERHLESTVDLLVRPDGRAYHTYMMDLNYGNPIMPKVDQGYADDSVWSRGQAWVILGLALAYGYNGDTHLRDVQRLATEKFIELLPKDNVPAWDMVFTDMRTLKDTSASAIAVCGMLEINKLEPDHALAGRWGEKVCEMMSALMTSHTARGLNLDSNAILIHGTSSVRHNMGVNESVIYGDYYYMEALVRMLRRDWNRYW